jgi:anti-sigma B factor antagonist
LPVPCSGCFNRGVGDDPGARLREPPVRGSEAVGAAVVVHLQGELDLYNAEELRSTLAETIAGGPARIVIDLADVEFVDSTALGVLLEAHARLAPGTLQLARPRLETRRALQVSGLDRRLPVFDSIDQAFAS